MDITQIPTSELVTDRDESIQDVHLCKIALRRGIETYSGGNVRERLEINQKIVKLIDTELERRQRKGGDNP